MSLSALLRLALVLLPCLLAVPARAAAANVASNAAPALTPADARQLLGVLNDPKKRAALVTTLTNLAKATAPVSPAAKAAAVAGLAPNSLGAEMIASAGTLGSALVGEAGDVRHAMRDFRELGPWLGSIFHDPGRRTAVFGALWRLVVVLAASLLAVFAINRAIRGPLGGLSRLSSGVSGVSTSDEFAGTAADGDTAEEDEVARTRRHRRSFGRLVSALRRVPFAVAHLLLALLPVVGFAAVAYVLQLTGFIGQPDSRVVIAAALRSFIVAGVLIGVTNALFAPDYPPLRLVLIGDRAARRVAFWIRLMLLVGAWGFSSITVMQTLGLSTYASLALMRALALSEHVLLAFLIVHSRTDVARRLHPPRRVKGPARRVLTTFANRWWVYAVVLDFAVWFVWALQIRNGYARLWTFTLDTFLVAVGARLVAIALLGALARTVRVDEAATLRHPWIQSRAQRYYPLMRRFVTVAVLAVAVVVLLQIWGLDAFGWFGRGALGGRLFSALAGSLVAMVVGLVIWEAANISLERHLDRLGRDPINGGVKAARVRTLMPILRIILSVALTAVIVLTILSEIGVNIAPLLGGAGIIGVAIGFGSQKLVQDFITGIFLLLENTMQVGDWVTAGGLSGSVEHLSIRTIRLRAGDGSVHMIPFSSVTTVTNTNRGLGNAPVSVDIDPAEDTDRAADVLKSVALTMRALPDYKDGMLSDLQYWGVDKVTSQAVTLVGQIACTDKARYGVQREYNRRMRIAFAEEGIRLAVPTQAVTVVRGSGEEAGRMPALAHEVHEAHDAHVAEGSESVAESPPTAALGHAQ